MSVQETNRVRTNRIAKAERTTDGASSSERSRARIKAFLDARG